MSDVPTTTNQAAQATSDIIDVAEYDAATPAVIAALVAVFPFLGWPIIGPIFTAIYNYFAKDLYTEFKFVGIKIVIRIQTDIEKSTYSNAEGALRAAQLTGDPIKIKEATDAFKKAAQSLIHFDGSADPTHH